MIIVHVFAYDRLPAVCAVTTTTIKREQAVCHVCLVELDTSLRKTVATTKQETGTRMDNARSVRKARHLKRRNQPIDVPPASCARTGK